ncbi:hypothetical protein GALMADRAFT_934028 [Galerina marginata CBS 339.88]|uniref:Uncharacterized protein n=1 Tax=Galerina marginata (strain CBS 339.88) TaxID=685588 RepID=A0A067SQN0_GALM3|nr:hypothetical protein GALMADRAFT_934028 [Galerina marginata CBS 339.88]
MAGNPTHRLPCLLHRGFTSARSLPRRCGRHYHARNPLQRLYIDVEYHHVGVGALATPQRRCGGDHPATSSAVSPYCCGIHHIDAGAITTHYVISGASTAPQCWLQYPTAAWSLSRRCGCHRETAPSLLWLRPPPPCCFEYPCWRGAHCIGVRTIFISPRQWEHRLVSAAWWSAALIDFSSFHPPSFFLMYVFYPRCIAIFSGSRPFTWSYFRPLSNYHPIQTEMDDVRRHVLPQPR